MKKNTINRFINKIKKNTFAIIIIFAILIIFLIENIFKKETFLPEAPPTREAPPTTEEIINKKSQSLGSKYSNTFTSTMK